MEQSRELEKSALALLMGSISSYVGDVISIAREAIKEGLGVYVIVSKYKDVPLIATVEPGKGGSVNVVDYAPEYVSEYLKRGEFNHRWIVAFQPLDSDFVVRYVDVVGNSRLKAVENLKELFRVAGFKDISPVGDDVYPLSRRDAAPAYAVELMEEYRGKPTMRICSKYADCKFPCHDFLVFQGFREFLYDALVAGKDVVKEYAEGFAKLAVGDLCRGSCHPYVSHLMDRARAVVSEVLERAAAKLARLLAKSNGVVTAQEIYDNFERKFTLVVDKWAFVAANTDCQYLTFTRVRNLKSWGPYGKWIIASSRTGKKKVFKVSHSLGLSEAKAEVAKAFKDVGII